MAVFTGIFFWSPIIFRDIYQSFNTFHPLKRHGNPFGLERNSHEYYTCARYFFQPGLTGGLYIVYPSEMKRSSTPIIIGVAQYTQQKDTERPLDPLSLMVNTSTTALMDTGKESVKALIDCVYVVNLFQWSYRDAPGALCKRLGINAGQRFYLPVGGNSPQYLVNKAARDLAAHRCKAVLMTGAEAIYSLRRALKGEVVLDWPESNPPERIDGDNIDSIDDREAAYDLFLPAFIYPLFETALRAASNRSPGEHQIFMGRLFAKLSRIASANPYAWIRKPLTAEQIAVSDAGNRIIGYPYTKSMNANINVDQSAALIMTTEEYARSIGIPESTWVYPLGGSELNDIWYVSRRPRLDESPAIRNASRIALEQAGLILDDIGVFDLYSCFPSAFEIARKEVGIPEDDPRDLSVTGGLPYFGGPGNNYSMHAIATVVERIREDRNLIAMVTANGWYLTKHSIGIYGGFPPVNPWYDRDDSAIQHSIDKEALPISIEKVSGVIKVEAYVVRHDNEGKPQKGTIIGRLSDGNRALADIDADNIDLLKMETAELVGKMGHVRYDPGLGKNLVRFSGL
jgi:acetyl-CoA C-acetyltransferase